MISRLIWRNGKSTLVRRPSNVPKSTWNLSQGTLWQLWSRRGTPLLSTPSEISMMPCASLLFSPTSQDIRVLKFQARTLNCAADFTKNGWPTAPSPRHSRKLSSQSKESTIRSKSWARTLLGSAHMPLIRNYHSKSITKYWEPSRSSTFSCCVSSTSNSILRWSSNTHLWVSRVWVLLILMKTIFILTLLRSGTCKPELRKSSISSS